MTLQFCDGTRFHTYIVNNAYIVHNIGPDFHKTSQLELHIKLEPKF